MTRFIRQRQDQADKVGFLQQRIKLAVTGVETFFSFSVMAAGIIQDGHVEAEMGALCQRQTDTAHPNNPQRFAMYVHAEPVRANAFRPFARFHALSHLHHATSSAEHQRHQRVGDGFRQSMWRVHQQDVARVKRIHVEIVVAHRNG